MDKFYTIDDVALILKLSPKSIRNLIREGELRAVHTGGTQRKTYRIWSKELDRYVAESYVKQEQINVS